MLAPRRMLGLLLVASALLMAACSVSGATSGRVKVVAAFYPLAWVAAQVGGSRVDVEDLTPPGVEAHDAVLTAGQRADLQTAAVLLILGRFGFQPDVEQAATEAQGRVVEVTKGMALRPSEERDLGFDPHVWLDPVLMEQATSEVAVALAAADPGNADTYRRGEAGTVKELEVLDAAFKAGLSGCRFHTFVATHEAFGYLAARYGLRQLGIEGLTPESEPSAGRIQAAVNAVRTGAAAPAVFYEGTDEGQRIGRSVASEIGVPALPLGTLEFDPAPRDYISVMRDDLTSLERGLRCS